MQVAVFDIDGTLADVRGYRTVAERNHCPARSDIVSMIDDFSDTIIVVLTFRPEYFRTQTSNWLREQGIRFDQLIMNASNKRDAVAYKRQQIEMLIGMGHEIIFAVDDEPSNCEMLREYCSNVVEA